MKSSTFTNFLLLLVWTVLILGPKMLNAEVDGSALWSMEFKSVSISEALKQIARTTGIEIIPPSRLGNQVITKSYMNQTVEHILRDVFRDMNYALVWSYGEKGVDSVKIISFDETDTVDVRYSPDALRSNANDHSAPEDPTQRQPPGQRQIPRSGGFMTDSEPDDSDVELTTEQEEEVDGPPGAESVEEENESISFSVESDEEMPVPIRRVPRLPDGNIENSAEEPPSIVGQSKDLESNASSQEEGGSTNP